MRRALYLAIRDLDASGLPERAGAPVLPVGWDVEPVPTTPAPTWIVRRPADPDAAILVVRCNVAGGRGLYAIRADRAWLDSLDQAEVAPAREVYRRALAGNATPRLVMRAWRWWRCDVTERATQLDVDEGRASAVGDPVQRDGVTRQLSAEGVLLPDPGVDALPWDLDETGELTTVGAAVRRVRALVRPALTPGGVPWTIAGAADHVALEDEEDRGA